jgi:hypothetical protein
MTPRWPSITPYRLAIASVPGKYRPAAAIQPGTCTSRTADTLKIITAVIAVSMNSWIR